MAEGGKTKPESVSYMLGLTKELRQQYSVMWKEWLTDLSYYYGRPSLNDANKVTNDLIVNLVFASVETHVSHMLLSKPEIFVRAVQEEYDDAAAAATNILHSVQIEAGLQASYQRLCRIASQTGTSLMLVRWEQPTGRPGQIKLDVLDPFTVYVDPNATSIDDAEYIIIEKYLTIAEARRQFPLMADAIPEMPKVQVEEPSYLRKAAKLARAPGPNELKEKENKRLRYLQAWVHGGRVIVEILGDMHVKQRILTEERESPYPNPNYHGTFPIVPFYATQDARSFWGISDIRNIRDPQDEVNKRMKQVIEVADHMRIIQSKLFVHSRDRDVDTDALKTTDFEIIKVQDIAHGVPRTIQSDALQQCGILLQMSQLSEYNIDQITGLYNPAKGEQATGVYSGRHAAALQSASAIRFQPRLDSVVTSFRRLGHLMLSLLQQYQMMDINKRTYYNPKGGQIKTHDEEGKPILPVLQDKDGKPLDFVPGFDPRFEIVVQPTDEVPMANQARGQLLLQIMQAGGADIEAVVRALRLPNGEAMLERIGKKAVAGLSPVAYYPDEVVEKLYQLAMQRIKEQVQAGNREGALNEMYGPEGAAAPEEQGQPPPPGAGISPEEQAMMQALAEAQGRPMGG